MLRFRTLHFSRISRTVLPVVALAICALFSTAELSAAPHQVMVGAGGGAVPVSPGIEERCFQPVPYMSYTYKDRLRIGLEGIAWNVLRPRKALPLQGTLCLLPHSGRNSEKLPDQYQDLEEVAMTVDGGVRCALPVAPGLILETLVLADILGRGHNGIHGEAALRWHSELKAYGLTLELSLAALAANSDYLHALYGVSPKAALSSSFDQYSPDHGWEGVRCGLMLKKQFLDNWNLLSKIELTSLQGQALHSPLVEAPNQLYLKVLAAYAF